MNYSLIIIVLLFVAIVSLLFSLMKREAFASSAKTIYLMGDSVLNNARYVPHKQSVEAQLRQQLSDSILRNLAEDGAKIQDLEQQLAKLDPDQMQHVVVSIGGNNILAGDALRTMQQQMRVFLAKLRGVVPAQKVTLLQVYQPSDPTYAIYKSDIAAWNAWLTKNNDGMQVIDLMYYMQDPDDFANVEPSGQGGKKIADALSQYLA